MNLHNSPVAVRNITLKLEYIGDDGKYREFSRTIGQRLEPGEQAATGTGIRDIPDTDALDRRVRVTVVAAEVRQ